MRGTSRDRMRTMRLVGVEGGRNKVRREGNGAKVGGGKGGKGGKEGKGGRRGVRCWSGGKMSCVRTNEWQKIEWDESTRRREVGVGDGRIEWDESTQRREGDGN